VSICGHYCLIEESLTTMQDETKMPHRYVFPSFSMFLLSIFWLAKERKSLFFFFFFMEVEKNSHIEYTKKGKD